ncbi:RecB family exonuclease [Virgisporangium ochraceum]|uniref:Exonuclease RecB n=1 Tax=Virgisporangium ochraceum TaxID=65505 RepID=A0A8J4A2P3_9ACTN|nr:PD-(D/E)XK nuclease family protein [Virgisporangium ochraceum]GIJ74744.1 exonuclease RecB [Virgisporangium ochraceum]
MTVSVERVLPSLSPSRAGDFKTCPLLYRFRTVDRLPEKPNADAVRGTLVHAVLDRLFDLPAAERTPGSAEALVEPEWVRMREEWAAVTDLFGEGLTEDEFVSGARALLGGYFAVEDPRRLEPAEREVMVETQLGDELLLRGIIDRLDVSPTGELRVVDYKTGGAPREAFEARALFQLKFYALVVWRLRGRVPRVLRLVYLKDAEVCDYTPDEEELSRFERTLVALWQAIERATADRDFRPRPSRLCGWCSYQDLCPAYGGTPPPYPEPRPPAEGAAAAGAVAASGHGAPVVTGSPEG